MARSRFTLRSLAPETVCFLWIILEIWWHVWGWHFLFFLNLVLSLPEDIFSVVFREEERERETDRHWSVVDSHAPQPGIKSTIWPFALTGNWIPDVLVHGTTIQPAERQQPGQGDGIFKKPCFLQVLELYRADDSTLRELFMFYAHSYSQGISTKG